MTSDVPHSQTPPDPPAERLDGTKGRIKLRATLHFRPVFVISHGQSVLSLHQTFTVPFRSNFQDVFLPEILPARSLELSNRPPRRVVTGRWRRGGSELGLPQLTLAPRSCAKSDVKCESRRRSERVINTQSPCALTNTLLYNLLLQRWQRNMRSIGPAHPSSLENLSDTLPYVKPLRPVDCASGPVDG